MVGLLIILCLILVNGLLAGTEIAVLSVRRPLFASQAKAGDINAQRVLDLLDAPNKFLSTIQIGITLVGILAGAFGGADAVRYLSPRLAALPLPGADVYAEPFAFGAVVLGITYLTLVMGELVPKRLGLQRSESIAKAMARPMEFLAQATRPAVWVLSASTDTVLRLLDIRDRGRPSVTEEEIRHLIAEGARTGVFVDAEQRLVDRIFRFADEVVADVMRPRSDIVALGTEESPTAIQEVVMNSGYSRFPVYRSDVETIIGVVHARDLLAQEGPPDLESLVRETLFVPATKSLLSMLQAFQTTHSHLAIVINEFGETEGLVTLEDVLEEIVGEIRDEYDREEPAVLRREDGSFLVDGSLSVLDLKELLGFPRLEGDDNGQFHTLGGFLMTRLRHVPREGDIVEYSGYRFEVVDMDGLRVDKVLVQRMPSEDGSA